MLDTTKPHMRVHRWTRHFPERFCVNVTVERGAIVNVSFYNRVIPDGDLNKRGGANSLDAALIQQLVAGRTSVEGLIQNFGLTNYLRGDVNEDGDFDATDALLILQFGAGLITSLPVGGGGG